MKAKDTLFLIKKATGTYFSEKSMVLTKICDMLLLLRYIFDEKYLYRFRVKIMNNMNSSLHLDLPMIWGLQIVDR